jgi:hypothetical protein
MTQMDSIDPEPSPRTIIDLLRRGNQELFHSSMIAWLLDRSKDAEHGLGDRFCCAVAERLSERGLGSLREALAREAEVQVLTEQRDGRNRYDILLHWSDGRIAFENKTKSIGSPAQTDRYERAAEVVPLGWCDVSFQFEDRHDRAKRLLTYGELLEVLDEVCADASVGTSPFTVLRDQYRDFLRRELGILDLIKRGFRDDDVATRAELAVQLAEPGRYPENDIRFFNLFHLASFWAWLGEGSDWGTLMNKDQPTGAWLASWPSERGSFRFADWVRALGSEDASYWFHLQLHPGLTVTGPDAEVGCIQLRTNASPVGDVRAAFRAAFQPRLVGEYRFGGGRGGATYFLLQRPLRASDLGFVRLKEQFLDFRSQFV